MIFCEDAPTARGANVGIASQTSRSIGFEPISLLSALAVQNQPDRPRLDGLDELQRALWPCADLPLARPSEAAAGPAGTWSPRPVPSKPPISVPPD